MNSYRRLWDTGFWAPVFADWGFQNRTTALRVSAPGRFEYRSVDSAVNPYLSMAALIMAMWDGIERKLDPGEPEERNIYAAMEAGKEVKKIPMTFGDALDALEADEVVKKALPGEMYTVFMHYKRDEWERFCATVTDWDVNEYLDILPWHRDKETLNRAMCGIAGIIYKDGEHPIGHGDDPDAPVDEAPRAGLDRLRALRPAVEPRDHALQARRREHAARLRVRGPAAPPPRRGRAAARTRSARASTRSRRRPSTPSASRSSTTATSRRSPTSSRTSPTSRCSRSATRSRSSRISATPRRWPAATT